MLSHFIVTLSFLCHGRNSKQQQPFVALRSPAAVWRARKVVEKAFVCRTIHTGINSLCSLARAPTRNVHSKHARTKYFKKHIPNVRKQRPRDGLFLNFGHRFLVKRWPMWSTLPSTRLQIRPYWLRCPRARPSLLRTKAWLRLDRNGPALTPGELLLEKPWCSSYAQTPRRFSSISRNATASVGALGARENVERGVARAPSPRDSVRSIPC